MKHSRLYNDIQKLNKLPSLLQRPIKNFVLGRAVPLVGTAGIKFEKTSPKEWAAYIPNKRHVRNHLKQLHACSMVLLAETIAIMIVAMNLPSDKLPLVKNINVDFVKRSTGSLKAKVSLTEDQINYIQTSEKGELPLEVHVQDEQGIAPIKVTVTAVWIPKK